MQRRVRGAHERQRLQGGHGAPEAPPRAVGLQTILQGLHAAQRALVPQLLQPHPLHIPRTARRRCSAGAARRPRCGALLQARLNVSSAPCSAPCAQARAVSPLRAGSSAAAPGRAARAPELHPQQRHSSPRPPQKSPSRTARWAHPPPACSSQRPLTAPLPSRAPQAAGAPATVH